MKAKDWAAFLLLSVLWGTSFLWIKIAVEEIGPATVVALRLSFGTLGLLAVLFMRGLKPPENLFLLGKLALVGLLNTALPFVLITWGEQHIDSALASLLNASVPLWTLLIAHFFLPDEHMRIEQVVGLLLGFAGITLLVTSQKGMSISFSSGGSMLLMGSLAVLVASVFYGISAVFIRSQLRGTEPTTQATFSVMFAGAFAWIGAFAAESPLTLPALPITWLAVVWLGLLGSALAYMLSFALIQSIGATRMTAVTYVIPLAGVSLGAIFLQEAVNWQMLLAGALVLVGVYIVNAGLPAFMRKPKAVGEQA